MERELSKHQPAHCEGLLNDMIFFKTLCLCNLAPPAEQTEQGTSCDHDRISTQHTYLGTEGGIYLGI